MHFKPVVYLDIGLVHSTLLDLCYINRAFYDSSSERSYVLYCDCIVWETVCKGRVLTYIFEVEVSHCSKIVWKVICKYYHNKLVF